MHTDWKDGVAEKASTKCTGNQTASRAMYYLVQSPMATSVFWELQSIPGIEFYQGVPGDIEKSTFLVVIQRNLIVLDDLMAQAGKDRRVADLFDQKEVIIGTCRWFPSCKIYFTKEKRWETSI